MNNAIRSRFAIRTIQNGTRYAACRTAIVAICAVLGLGTLVETAVAQENAEQRMLRLERRLDDLGDGLGTLIRNITGQLPPAQKAATSNEQLPPAANAEQDATTAPTEATGLSGHWQDQQGNRYLLAEVGSGKSAGVVITSEQAAGTERDFYSIHGVFRPAAASGGELSMHVDGLYPVSGKVSDNHGEIVWQGGRLAALRDGARWTKVGSQARPELVAGRVKLRLAGTNQWLGFPVRRGLDEHFLEVCSATAADVFLVVRLPSGSIKFQDADGTNLGRSGHFIAERRRTEWQPRPAGEDSWRFEVALPAEDSRASVKGMALAAPRIPGARAVVVPTDALRQDARYTDQFQLVPAP